MLSRYIRSVNIFIKSLFAPKGVVGPHTSAREWDEQFSSRKWDYLADDNQREHYDCIIDMYSEHGNGGNILDIGCGVGLLYRCFKDTGTLQRDKYLGIDISSVAIEDATKQNPDGWFEVLNYQTHSIKDRYGVIVFNETLYYFDHAGKTLQKCINENLEQGGVVIISMCDHERHEQIWQLIDNTYQVLDVQKSSNEEGISWTVKVIKP